jgi:hypothetical protein
MSRLALPLLLLLAAGCAAPLVDLPDEQRREICDFLDQRALQGDFAVCFLGAQRVAARLPGFGSAIAPAVAVHATVVYTEGGGVAAVRKLRTDLPSPQADDVLDCFESALRGAPIPPPGRRLAVPVTLLADPLERTGESGVATRTDRCLVHPMDSGL